MKNKKMNQKRIRFSAAAAGLLLLCAMLTGCQRTSDAGEDDYDESEGDVLFTEEETDAPDTKSMVQLTWRSEDDCYVAEDGTVYRAASVSYEPTQISEPYAALGDHVFYRIGQNDPKEWLTDEFTGQGMILYRSDIALPGPDELEPTVAFICLQQAQTLGLGTIDDAELLAKLLRKIRTGVAVETEIPDDTVYTIKMANENWPAFYYSVTFYEKKDGTCCVYDRARNKSVVIGDLLHDYVTTREEYESAVNDMSDVQ